jgi:hypothetical protein
MPGIPFYNHGYPLDTIADSAKHLSPLFAPMGDQSDRVLLDVEVPNEYWDYLADSGIDHCRPVPIGEDVSGYTAVPWGWNEQSAHRLSGLGARCRAPDLAIVKAVNSRAWCVRYNRETGTGVPGTAFCASEEEFRLAAEALAGRFPLVVKPAFGSSGYGFVKIRSREDLSGDRLRQCAVLLGRGGCTIEPWLERLGDLSSSCVITMDRTVTDPRLYRCHITGHGAFYGVSLGTDDPVLNRFRVDLEQAAGPAAQALAQAGYFGPASFDSFVYRDREGERLAPVIEINARHGMSALACSLQRKTGLRGCCLLRFISRKKAGLPESYVDFYKRIGSDRYDQETGKGIVLVSPLRLIYGKETIQPARSVFFLQAEKTEDLWNLDQRLMAYFGPPSMV